MNGYKVVFVAVLVFLAFLICTATDADATVVGPPGSGVAPEYCPHVIPVYDMLYNRLGPVHQTKWIAGRNQAFAEWELPFSISITTEVVEWNDENVNSGAVQDNATQCAIFIIKDRTSAPGDSGGLLVSPAGGAIILNPWSGWWQAQVGQDNISAVTAHEAGHALGFNHGTEGVMGGSQHVNQNERDAARDYYEGIGFIY